MKLAFLQNLENLSLDGESFLAQFLEFLLDQSLSGNKKYDQLIWATAEVLDLKLPISTVSSAFALLQVKISQNKQKNNSQSTFKNNSQNTFQNTVNSSQNSNSNSLSQIIPNSSQESKQLIQKTGQNNTNKLNPNCIQKVDLEGENDEKNDENSHLENQISKENPEQKNLQKINQNQNIENTNATEEIRQKQNNQSSTLHPDNSNNTNSTKSVSLSSVHNFLINKIKDSKEMNLKLLLSDLALEKIDLDGGTGLLTLSSGALLAFLKNKKNLDWISQSLEEEFGWKLTFGALQRETKTILFPSDAVLKIAKNNYQGKIEEHSTNEQKSNQNTTQNSITNSSDSFKILQNSNLNTNLADLTNQNQSLPNFQSENNSQNQEKTTKANQKEERNDKKEEEKFYKLYSKNGKFPFNFDGKKIDLISKIALPKKEEINWQEFSEDFELE